MRLEIRYLNQFTYPEPVRESHNLLRACPCDDARQQLIDYRVVVEPAARILSYVDYWGTRVDAFGIRERHDRLVVAAEAVVETSMRTAPEQDVALDRYLDTEVRVGLGQYLQPSRHADWGGEIAAAARDLNSGHSDVRGVIDAVDGYVHDSMTYTPGVTDVGIDIDEVFAQRRGVCQDFAHLSLAMYRSIGIPARYVSGYVYASDPSGSAAPEQAEVEIQTHAWVEVFIPGFGWWGRDPTNALAIGERHVKIGHGRDYDDVMPMRGAYHGPGEHALGVSVSISREDLSRLEQQQVEQ